MGRPMVLGVTPEGGLRLSAVNSRRSPAKVTCACRVEFGAFHSQRWTPHIPATPCRTLPATCRLLSRGDWPTQQMAAKLLTAVLDTRPTRGEAFAAGVLSGDAGSSASSSMVYGQPDVAEQVGAWRACVHVCVCV